MDVTVLSQLAVAAAWAGVQADGATPASSSTAPPPGTLSPAVAALLAVLGAKGQGSQPLSQAAKVALLAGAAAAARALQAAPAPSATQAGDAVAAAAVAAAAAAAAAPSTVRPSMLQAPTSITAPPVPGMLGVPGAAPLQGMPGVPPSQGMSHPGAGMGMQKGGIMAQSSPCGQAWQGCAGCCGGGMPGDWNWGPGPKGMHGKGYGGMGERGPYGPCGPSGPCGPCGPCGQCGGNFMGKGMGKDQMLGQGPGCFPRGAMQPMPGMSMGMHQMPSQMHMHHVPHMQQMSPQMHGMRLPIPQMQVAQHMGQLPASMQQGQTQQMAAHLQGMQVPGQPGQLQSLQLLGQQLGQLLGQQSVQSPGSTAPPATAPAIQLQGPAGAASTEAQLQSIRQTLTDRLNEATAVASQMQISDPGVASAAVSAPPPTVQQPDPDVSSALQEMMRQTAGLQKAETSTEDKSDKVRSLVEAAKEAAAAMAASSAAAAKEMPTPQQQQKPASASSAPKVQAPPSGARTISFVPTPTTRPATSAPGFSQPDKPRSRSRSGSELKRRRKGDRERERVDRGRRKSRSRSNPGRRRSKSRSRPRASGRSSVFTNTADAGAAQQFVKPDPAKLAQVQLQQEEVPDWLQDLAAPAGPIRKKVIRMPDSFIKCLIGRGGETIRWIINRTGADIQVRSNPQDPEGIVSIVGHVDVAEGMIREVLASKGCYMPTAPAAAPQIVEPMSALSLPNQQVDQETLLIPSELVGLFIGAEGAGIKDIKAKVGGAVSIKVLAPILQGGFQEVQVVGDHWKAAKEIARQKIEEYKRITPGRWNMPGWHAPSAGATAEAGSGSPTPAPTQALPAAPVGTAV